MGQSLFIYRHPFYEIRTVDVTVRILIITYLYHNISYISQCLHMSHN